MWSKQKHSSNGKDTKRKSDSHDHVQSKNRKQNESDSDVSEPCLSIEKRGNKGKSDNIGTPSCSNKRQNHVSFTVSTQSSGSDSENNNSVSAVHRVKNTNKKLKAQNNVKKTHL